MISTFQNNSRSNVLEIYQNLDDQIFEKKTRKKKSPIFPNLLEVITVIWIQELIKN